MKTGSDPVGYFCLALHTHMPFVLHHGSWPDGIDWVNEAVTESYLPLLNVFERLKRDGIPVKVTMDMTPVICEQLAAPDFPLEIARFIGSRLAACDQDKSSFPHTGNHALMPVVDYWRNHYLQQQEWLKKLPHGILGALKLLSDQSVIELNTSAATHAYLPLLSRDESVRAQLRLGRATHERHFGVTPKGIWLPECAYRPRYVWTAPIGGRSGTQGIPRPGLEELINEAGLQYFITDTHMIRGGRIVPMYREFFPGMKRHGEDRSYPSHRTGQETLYPAYRVRSRGGQKESMALVRDPHTSLQVWSRELGYPGGHFYLDFHKRHLPGGLRYWRVTHPKADISHKEPYQPQESLEKVKADAAHFVALVKTIFQRHTQATKGVGMICSPYDTELFGHWWFEGPEWLYYVFKGFAENRIEVLTGSEYLAKHPPTEALNLLEGSWGDGGDHRMWLNHDTEWMWDRIYDAETEIVELTSQHLQRGNAVVDRILSQALRELMLMQGSDWAFLITTSSARDYAERRFAEHYGDFKRLMELTKKAVHHEPLSEEEEGHLRRLERVNSPFPDIAKHWPLNAGDYR